MIQKPDHVHVVDAPDAFRGKFTGKTAARDYAEQVNQVLEENKGKVAAYIGRDCDSEFYMSVFILSQHCCSIERGFMIRLRFREISI